MINEVIETLKAYTDGKDNVGKVEISVMKLNRIIRALEQQPTDVVSRQAAINAAIDGADKWDGGSNREREKCIQEEIDKLPSVTPQPKMGRWIKNAEKWQNVDPPYICSECGRASLRQENFCCSCGAKMQEVEE